MVIQRPINRAQEERDAQYHQGHRCDEKRDALHCGAICVPEEINCSVQAREAEHAAHDEDHEKAIQAVGAPILMGHVGEGIEPVPAGEVQGLLVPFGRVGANAQSGPPPARRGKNADHDGEVADSIERQVVPTSCFVVFDFVLALDDAHGNQDVESDDDPGEAHVPKGQLVPRLEDRRPEWHDPARGDDETRWDQLEDQVVG
mmetsp:Transcript_25980/g.78273  ORF Transcript_25980/g.78273 Transcript_25980/m.78273 type:complete len:202 (-) Transcript_25980:1675-2280(-)